MTEQEMAALVDGDDVLGRRGFFANVDRARAFGSNTLSGILDVVGGAVIVIAIVLVSMLLAHEVPGRTPEDDWVIAALVAAAGATSGLMLFALSRLVTYAKACAVLLAKLSADRS